VVKRYLKLNQCDYISNSGDNYTSIVNTLTAPFNIYNAGTNASNTPQAALSCGPGQAGDPLNSGASGLQTVDLLGQRYLNLNQCDYITNTPDNYTSIVNTLTAPFNIYNAGTNASNTPQAALSCGPGQAGDPLNSGASGLQTIDLLDTARGAGFVQFSITAPSPASTTTYNESAALTGTAAAASSGSITIQVVAAALVNGGAIGGIAVFVAVMLGGLIGYRRLRVDTPTAR
jgi:hypothetical protein